MIRIVSKYDGFRRCGVAHYRAGVEHAADRFTAAELAVLQREPMLTVEKLPEPAPPKAKKQAGGAPPGTGREIVRTAVLKKKAELAEKTMTVAQLTEALTAAGVEVAPKALKAELVDLYVRQTEAS